MNSPARALPFGEGVALLGEWMSDADSVVFFGGAGVSTESGIPDFRGKGGIGAGGREIPFEILLSADYLAREPEAFFRFARDSLAHPLAEPNAAHRALARLEAEGRLSAVITQNIDGLHQRAGSENVVELHGSLDRNYCADCGRRRGAGVKADSRGIPRCACGGVVRPDVTLYGEGLDPSALARARGAIASADVLIVAGTSLTVYPAAGLIDCYGGHRLALINRTATERDDAADLIIRGSVGEALGALADNL